MYSHNDNASGSSGAKRYTPASEVPAMLTRGSCTISRTVLRNAAGLARGETG